MTDDNNSNVNEDLNEQDTELRNTELDSNNNSNEPDIDPHDKRRHLSKHDRAVMWRRNQVANLLSQGCTTYDVASILKISQTTAYRDSEFLRQAAANELKMHIQNLPHEYQMAYRGLSQCLRYAWSALMEDNSQSKNKASIIMLIADIYEKRMNLCTNPSVIEESLSYAEQAKKEIKGELIKQQ